MQVHKLTKDRSSSKKYFRDGSMQEFYEKVYDSLDAVYEQLKGYQKDTFDFVDLNRDKPITTIASRLSRFSTTIFDETPSLSAEFNLSKRFTEKAATQEPNGVLHHHH